MPRIYSPVRHTKVPWLWPSDLEEGQPCTFERTFEHVHTSMWRVTLYDKETAEMGLVLQAQRGNGNDGGTISLAIRSLGGEPQAPAMRVELLSNPIRYGTEDDGQE